MAYVKNPDLHKAGHGISVLAGLNARSAVEFGLGSLLELQLYNLWRAARFPVCQVSICCRKQHDSVHPDSVQAITVYVT